MATRGLRCILSSRLTPKRTPPWWFSSKRNISYSHNYGNVLKSVGKRWSKWAWSLAAVAGISCLYYPNWGSVRRSILLPQVSASEEEKKDAPKVSGCSCVIQQTE